MCLIVKSGCHPEIATKDITCWKFVNMLREDKWMAPIRRTLHDYDKVLIACDRLSVEPWHVAYGILHFVIEEGFHAYTNIDNAKNKTNIFNARILVKCTIPKGAEYCLGPNAEIVATKMIVHKPIGYGNWYCPNCDGNCEEQDFEFDLKSQKENKL